MAGTSRTLAKDIWNESQHRFDKIVVMNDRYAAYFMHVCNELHHFYCVDK